MREVFVLVKRNIKEVLRDTVSLVFCLGLPAVMLIVMELLFGNIDESGAVMFEINNFAPAIANFGFTFTMLFVALTIAGDKNTAFTSRLFVSPVTPVKYLSSFIISSIPISVAQTIIFYIIAFIFGLSLNGNTLLSVLILLPSALFYISCGILIGTISKTDKQAGPMCSVIITGSGLLGGIWMPIEVIGGNFLKVCKVLPFYNGVLCAKNCVLGDFKGIIIPILIVLGYAVIVYLISFFLYIKTAKK